MGQPSDGAMTGDERQEAPETAPAAPAPPPPSRGTVAAGVGWVVAVVAIAAAVATGIWSHRERRALQAELSALREAVAAARQVFLKRASDELGYASVDLEGELPNRYQARFRIGEALRWLQDAEPLLSQEGRRQLAALRQMLQQLAVTAEQDPPRARQDLARARDALERLIRTETQLR